MMRIDEEREHEFRARQDGRLYPLGRALRATYDAENHDTLGSDVTGLMIDLSKVPYEHEAPSASAPDGRMAMRTWRARIAELFVARQPSA